MDSKPKITIVRRQKQYGNSYFSTATEASLSSARKSDQDKSVRSGREKPATKHCLLLASCERPSLLFQELEAASAFASVMTQITQRVEVIIERDAKPDAVVCPAVWQYHQLVARANMVFSKMT